MAASRVESLAMKTFSETGSPPARQRRASAPAPPPPPAPPPRREPAGLPPPPPPSDCSPSCFAASGDDYDEAYGPQEMSWEEAHALISEPPLSPPGSRPSSYEEPSFLGRVFASCCAVDRDQARKAERSDELQLERARFPRPRHRRGVEESTITGRCRTGVRYRRHLRHSSVIASGRPLLAVLLERRDDLVLRPGRRRAAGLAPGAARLAGLAPEPAPRSTGQPAVWKSTSTSCILRNRHRHAIEQASRRWR